VDTATVVEGLTVGVVSRVMRARRSAESEVTRLEQAVTRWQGEAEAKRAELVELRTSMGERVYADETGTASREISSAAMDLQFQVDGAEAAAAVADRQLRDARSELALAQAAEKRQEAAKLTAVADAHQAKVDELLAQLEALDGPRYVPFQPSAEDRQYALQTNQSLSWIGSKADLLRDPIAPLLAEADALEAPVLAERRAREVATRPLVPSAQIDVPAWDDIDSDTTISCRVSEGAGSAHFEIGRDESFRHLVTLPDEQGRRSFAQRLRLQPGGKQEIRCNGEVLAKAERPGRLVSNGLGSFWVQLD
jgi:hypothetical protein